MQAVHTSVILAILCTSGVWVIGLQSPKAKGRNSKSKVQQSFFEGTQCGISKSAPNSARIIGGNEAKPHSWPWQVLVYCKFFDVKLQRDDAYSCGGAIISENWIVTAAHCLDSRLIDIERDCQVACGKHDMQRDEPTQVMAKVADYFNEPHFNRISLDYDIALLKLTKPLEFNDAIQPICLPFGLKELPYNKSCYATGWGATEYGSKTEPEKLMQLSMSVAEKHYCKNPTGYIICAVTWEENKNTGDGDSGGPLACQESDGKWYLRGVLSHGDEKSIWSVFTRVASYDQWIKSTISHN